MPLSGAALTCFLSMAGAGRPELQALLCHRLCQRSAPAPPRSLPGHWATDGHSCPCSLYSHSARAQAGLTRGWAGGPCAESCAAAPQQTALLGLGGRGPRGWRCPGPPLTALAEPRGPPEAQARGLWCGLWAEGSGLPAQPGLLPGAASPLTPRAPAPSSTPRPLLTYHLLSRRKQL